MGSDGVLYCSCPDYQFRGHKANRATGGNYICKHVRAFLVRASRMIVAGVAMDSEVIIYNQAVTEAAIERLGEAAISGAKSGRRVA
ncbi:MAG: SWIM zinc finger family protein [Anaerolineaceae bacterium]|nr:SWIM zinc finger family protein [Anaerolineaceae bacterium]